MEEMITLDPASRLRKRQATEGPYPRAGGNQRDPEASHRPRVSFVDVDEDEEMQEDDAGESDAADESQEETMRHDATASPEPADTPAVMATKRKKTVAGTRGTSGPRKVPVKLRAEAEPEKMVDKILKQTIDDITIREVLGLSPDLRREIWGIRQFPTVKASIPTTQVAEQAPVECSEEQEVRRFGAAMNAIPPAHAPKDSAQEAMQHLYACASPMVIGKVEDKYRVNMLIDSSSEMCVMSKALWQRMMPHLPIGNGGGLSLYIAAASRGQREGFRWFQEGSNKVSPTGWPSVQAGEGWNSTTAGDWERAGKDENSPRAPRRIWATRPRCNIRESAHPIFLEGPLPRHR